MRPAEVLALETGCCPEPEHAGAGTTHHYQIFGRHFKDARDENGRHVDSGLLRDTPWVTISHVAAAIKVLEQMVGTGLLFTANIHHRTHGNRNDKRSLNSRTMAERAHDFTTWVNDNAEHLGRGHETIPADPHGSLNPTRFRRTLAWHIARQPDGLIALAIQYGHLRTVVSEGYASRSRGGIHDLLDYETARTVADHLTDLSDDLARGEGVSGPAARRLIQAADRCTERFSGTVTTSRQYKVLLSDPLLNVFENKRAYLTCNYDPAKAFCHPDRAVKDATPSLDRCQAGCANIARTDRHAEGLRAEADRLEAESAAEITPEIIADRLRARAAHLRDLAERHDTDRITTSQEHDQ